MDKAEAGAKTQKGTGTTIPDGGYGWVIVLARFLQFGVMIQLVPMFGIIFGKKFEQFGATATEKSSVFGVYMTCTTLVSLFVGPLGQVTSERCVAVIAAVIQVSGLIISAFATSSGHLILGFGVLCGIGTGMCAINSILIVNKYFKQKIGMALGISAALVSFSGLLIPQLLKVLVSTFSPRDVLLIYAALSALLTLTGAALMRPVRSYSKVVQQEDGAEKEDKKHALKNIPKVLKNIFTLIEWSLLKNPYVLFILTANAVFMTVFILQMSEISFVAKSRGFSVSAQANLVTILCTTDIVTRFAQGFIMDLPALRSVSSRPVTTLYMANVLVMALAMLGLALAASFPELAVLVCILSFTNSCVTISYSQLLREQFPASFTSALGLQSLFRIVAAVAIPPLGGVLKEYFIDFRASLFFEAALALTTLLAWFMIDVTRKKIPTGRN